MATQISLKGKSDKLCCPPGETADAVERSGVGPWSICHSFADITSLADRFHRTLSAFNGQTVTRHQIGLIDAVVSGEVAESCK